MERFSVTTPIYYANGKPHIGHAYTTIAVDVLARLNKKIGREVFFLTGTDEHGGKVADTAAGVDKEPQKFVDEIAQSFKDCWKKLDIDYSDFIRTTEKRHEQGVVFALKKLKEADAIYEKTYKGLYCTGCEAFVTEKDLDENGLEPLHQKKPIVVEEKNWFFRLEKFLPEIKQGIEDDKILIIPSERKNEVLGLFQQGLEDFSISRSKERLKWGITLPFDDSQVAYVWVDALLNYVTALGYGSDNDELLKKFWPVDTHAIGLDILKFHAIYWPAMLMALGLQLPKQLLVNGYFTINGQKMSKSLGNVIDPNILVDEFGSDATRYLLLSTLPYGNSGDIDVQNFQQKYNELANTIGNLVRRTFNLAEKYGVKYEKESHNLLEFYPQLGNKNENVLDTLIKLIRGQAQELNVGIDNEAPWKETDETKRNEIVLKYLRKVFELADLLEPVMPKIAAAIFGSVDENGKITNPPVLFPKKV
jgi:methionyl-tRNA synthetase